MAGIVVGMDGSAGSRHALAWALEEGKLRDTEVRAVFVLERQYVDPEWASLMKPPIEQLREEAERLLQEWVEKAGVSPGRLRQEVVVAKRQGPAKTLLDAAEGAELVVVGSRGGGGFHGLLLGGVSQQVLHHTGCPVVVVPPGD